MCKSVSTLLLGWYIAVNCILWIELLTNATVVDDAIRFVSDRSKEKLKPSASSSNEDNKKEESNEPNYNEEKGQLE